MAKPTITVASSHKLSSGIDALSFSEIE